MTAAAAKHRSPFRLSMRRFARNKLAMTCLAAVVVFAVACIAGPWLLSVGYAEQHLEQQRESPSGEHWFGTDGLGRDLLARCLVGGRVSLAIGLVGTLVSVVIGVAYGAVAGYAGGRTDNLMMRVVDVLYGLPYILFVVLIMAMMGRDISPTQRIIAMFVALGAVQWLTMARIVRGEVVGLRERAFVEAARAAGARGGRIVFRHIIPNLAGVVIVYASLTVPQIMLQEAFLSFLGLGVQQPLPSWGSLIRDGAEVIGDYWWLVVLPGGMFTTMLFALNFLGDGLRDAFDPQMRA
jgi:oligopeptide transport system permease protein